jgi:hypothetical protein
MADDVMFDDPEPWDEDSPENEEESFELSYPLTPDQLPGASPEYIKKYTAWLEAKNSQKE